MELGAGLVLWVEGWTSRFDGQFRRAVTDCSCMWRDALSAGVHVQCTSRPAAHAAALFVCAVYGRGGVHALLPGVRVHL